MSESDKISVMNFEFGYIKFTEYPDEEYRLVVSESQGNKVSIRMENKKTKNRLTTEIIEDTTKYGMPLPSLMHYLKEAFSSLDQANKTSTNSNKSTATIAAAFTADSTSSQPEGSSTLSVATTATTAGNKSTATVATAAVTANSASSESEDSSTLSVATTNSNKSTATVATAFTADLTSSQSEGSSTLSTAFDGCSKSMTLTLKAKVNPVYEPSYCFTLLLKKVSKVEFIEAKLRDCEEQLQQQERHFEEQIQQQQKQLITIRAKGSTSSKQEGNPLPFTIEENNQDFYCNLTFTQSGLYRGIPGTHNSNSQSYTARKVAVGTTLTVYFSTTIEFIPDK
eukprot:scaffold7806_cov250-Ochromonas_danica.AAC.2